MVFPENKYEQKPLYLGKVYNDMSDKLIRRLITVKEYHLMAETGILTDEDRVELLNGEIIHMSPIGSRHMACVNRIVELIVPLLEKRAILSTQNPVVLNNLSEPEPDLALLKKRDDHYLNKKPGPEDTLLLIEVSDSTLIKDREVKLPIYARAGIPELWIINIEKNEVEVYKEALEDTYKIREIIKPKDTLELESLSITLSASDILE